MIRISDKINCCGCSSCAQQCPKGCIMMKQDEEGFLYPQVDSTTCIDCGLCEKVCPELGSNEKRNPTQAIAAINKKDDIRLSSSSGGIFTLLAEKILKENGVVFGARFDDDWQVTLDYTETPENLSVFRGSKYVQARVGDTYKQCERFLKDGRKVLFSGTPCQIAGLNHYLRREYENLYLVDIACHGVPSPKVWRKYLAEKNQKPLSILFRNKRNGWRNYFLTIESTEKLYCVPFNEDPYFLAFVRNLTLRPSCFACPFKSGSSGSDITLADFWGVEILCESMYDDKGTSLVLTFTSKGTSLIESLEFVRKSIDTDQFYKYNPALVHNPKEHRNRRRLFKKLNTSSDVTMLLKKQAQEEFNVRAIRAIKTFLRKILGR